MGISGSGKLLQRSRSLYKNTVITLSTVNTLPHTLNRDCGTVWVRKQGVTADFVGKKWSFRWHSMKPLLPRQTQLLRLNFYGVLRYAGSPVQSSLASRFTQTKHVFYAPLLDFATAVTRLEALSLICIRRAQIRLRQAIF